MNRQYSFGKKNQTSAQAMPVNALKPRPFLVQAQSTKTESLEKARSQATRLDGQIRKHLTSRPLIQQSMPAPTIQRLIDLGIDGSGIVKVNQTSKRPSGLGGHQGDHTTPYTSLQDQVANAIAEVSLSDAWINLSDTLKVYKALPGWTLSTKWIQNTLGPYVEGLLSTKGDISALQVAVTQMLTLRNQIALTSLPNGGHGNAEGKWAGSLQYQERQFQLGNNPVLPKKDVLDYIWKAFDHGRVNKLEDKKRNQILEQHARTMADAYPLLNGSLGINYTAIVNHYSTQQNWAGYLPA